MVKVVAHDNISFTGHSLLVSGHRLLGTGTWSLVAGYWLKYRLRVMRWGCDERIGGFYIFSLSFFFCVIRTAHHVVNPER